MITTARSGWSFFAKSLNRASLDQWLDEERSRVLRNYRRASADCRRAIACDRLPAAG